MNRRELVAFLNDIEQKYPVETWIYRGVQIWPVIKIDLFFKYLNKHIEVEKGNTIRAQSLRGAKMVGSIIYYILFKFTKRKKAHVLFSDGIAHYSAWQGQKVNRFYYPLEECLKTKDHVTSITRVSINEGYSKDFYKNDEIVFVEKAALALILFRKIRSVFSISSPPLNCTRFPDLYQDINDGMPGLFTSLYQFETMIKEKVGTIQGYKYLYLDLLKKTKVKAVFELCYYTLHHFGLTLAAKEMGIPSYEIMHGGMGNLHIAYSGWENKIPKKGYNVLPQYMWLWDKQSNDLVQTWMQRQGYHDSFIGGFPWLDYLISEYKGLYKIAQKKKVIVYTLQYEFIEEYIYDAIRDTKEDYEWWLRLHPRKVYARNRIVEELKQRAIFHKVNIEEANTIPLPLILSKCYVHISAFSGSIIEAAILKRNTIIISEVGAEAYYQYVETGLCTVSLEKSAEALVHQIYSVATGRGKAEEEEQSNLLQKMCEQVYYTLNPS